MMAFASPQAWNRWLKDNHATEQELWIKIYRKKTGIASVSWDEVVIEALCWGWIDGIKKSLNDQAYLQRVTPRKPRSQWSKRNTEHVERLLKEERMQEPGLIHVRAAKADGRWADAYRVSEWEVPGDFVAALANRPKAKAFFETLTKSGRSPIAHGLNSAKKRDTRQRRFDQFIAQLERQEKP